MDPPGEDFYKIYIEILNDEQQIEDIEKLFSLDTTGHHSVVEHVLVTVLTVLI